MIAETLTIIYCDNFILKVSKKGKRPGLNEISGGRMISLETAEEEQKKRKEEVALPLLGFLNLRFN